MGSKKNRTSALKPCVVEDTKGEMLDFGKDAKGGLGGEKKGEPNQNPALKGGGEKGHGQQTKQPRTKGKEE